MPSAPGPLLVERRVITGEDVYVDRITADGRAWSYTTVDARPEDGEWSFRRAEAPEWREEARLPLEALAALRAAVEDSGFFEAPAAFHPDVAVIHGSSEQWTAELGGRRHTSILHARGTTSAPPLAALAQALEAALASTDAG